MVWSISSQVGLSGIGLVVFKNLSEGTLPLTFQHFGLILSTDVNYNLQ
jgi:hypothetical protein